MKHFAYRLCACAVALSVVACSSGNTTSGVLPSRTAALIRPASGSSPITHVVVIVQENRTFNNLFATFGRGTTGTTTGKELVNGKTVTIKLRKSKLLVKTHLNHSYAGFLKAWDNGNMDSFNLVKSPIHAGTENSGPYQYVNPNDIAPYWDMAKQYVLADHTFQIQGSGSFTAHQELIAGGTKISPSRALIDNPSYFPWGCDARTPDPNERRQRDPDRDHPQERRGQGVRRPVSVLRLQHAARSARRQARLLEVLRGEGVPVDQVPEVRGFGIWSAFDAIKAVRYDKTEWRDNVPQSNLRFFSDLKNHQLPGVSWIMPNGANSDHPGSSSDTGPSWVASIVNAIGKSSYWDSTAIIIMWDDWGGLYDLGAPPTPRDNRRVAPVSACR